MSISYRIEAKLDLWTENRVTGDLDGDEENVEEGQRNGVLALAPSSI